MYSIHAYSPMKVFLPELTLDNYRTILDLYYVRLFGRTLRLGLITTAVCIALGYPLAYFLARALPRVQALCLFLLIMPLMVSAVIRVFGWIVILGRKGLVNQALVALGLEPIKLLYSETAVVIGLVNIFVPFMVLPIMGRSRGFRSASRRQRRTSAPIGTKCSGGRSCRLACPA
jgi:putative spermidine/putrescine transport system permease protein